MYTIKLEPDTAWRIKAAHQKMVRAAKEFHLAQQELKQYVADVRLRCNVPEDDDKLRWLMREDATAFYSVPTDEPLDFTRPIKQAGE